MPRNIKSVRYYGCGYCTNNLGMVLRGHGREERQFKAGVFLIEHEKHGLVLFDTGYNEDVTKAGLVGRLYGLFNPTHVTRADTITVQLKRDGIDVADIKTVILSHLHPDHIGCLQDFRRSDIILSEEAMCSYRFASPFALIMKRYFPNNFENIAWAIPTDTLNTKQYKFFKGYDLYDDGSIILTQLDGHARGQIGALIEGKIFLGADACWGVDLIEESHNMKFPATKIQHNMKAYKQNLRKMARMRNAGIRLCFSHDKYEKEELL